MRKSIGNQVPVCRLNVLESTYLMLKEVGGTGCGGVDFVFGVRDVAPLVSLRGV